MIKNEEHILHMKKIVLDSLNKFFNENIVDDQLRWEYLKYDIRKHTINFSKIIAKNTNNKIADLETKLKHFDEHYDNYVDNTDYKVSKQQLEEKAKDIKIRGESNWYEHGEKFPKVFLDLENIVQCKVRYILLLLTKMKLKIRLK